MDKDVIGILKLILSRSVITLQELEKESNYTKRQLTYRIDKINHFLKQGNHSIVTIGQHKEIALASETRTYLTRFLEDSITDREYFLDKKERMDYLFMMLFNNPDYVSLQHFIQSLQLSRSTIISDLKELNAILVEHHIQICHNREKGYYLNGNEVDIRSYMMKLIILSLSDEKTTKVLDMLIEELYIDTFDYSKLVISELSMKHGIAFVGDRLDEFIYIFIFLKARINNSKVFDFDGHYLPYFEKIKSMKEFAFTQELMQYYKNVSGINENELNYISAWILAVSVGNIDVDTQDSQIIADIVGRIMTRFEYLSGSHYSDSEEIFKQLYSHFRPAYYRLLFRLPIFNPLCHRIQIQYKEFYSLVEETMKPFHPLFGGEVPEDELAYLTVHFASIFSQQNVSDEIPKKNALIVCSNGIGSSAILYNQLKEMFPELHFYYPIASAKFNEFDQAVDIVFTTMTQSYPMFPDIPTIKVNPIMDLQEKYIVISEVCQKLGNPIFKQPSIQVIMDIVKKYTNITDELSLQNELLLYFSSNKPQPEMDDDEGIPLSQMLTRELIVLNIEAKDWVEAVQISGEKLVRTGKVSQLYVDKVIEVNQYKPQFMVIAPNVALPHTRPEFGVQSCAMGLATLKKPILFGNSENNPVKYIFFLSATDNHTHLPAMTQLLEFLNDESFFQLLDGNASEDDIIAYIKAREK